jgi:hyperosmotically inducible protein
MSKVLFASFLFVALALGMTACDSDNNGGSRATTSPSPKMSDSDLKSAIKTRLDSDAQLKADDLSVSADADKNTATLSGTVESEALRTKAVEMARAAHSGLVITDKIDVKPREIERKDYTEENARETREQAKSRGETVGSSMDDAWIHTKVVTKLIGDARTPERKINVDVVNNVVTLRGAVRTAEEKAAAEQVAKSVDGVKSVKNMLKIDPNA